MNKELTAKVNKIITEKKNCVLSLIDSNGFPTSSVKTVSKSDGINWFTFCTGLSGNSAVRAKSCGRAAVCFPSEEYSVGFVGEIEVITDEAVKKEMWYDGLENHFKGIDDPNYCVLKFKTKRYNLFIDWEENTGELGG